jgi:hypothetical protein
MLKQLNFKIKIDQDILELRCNNTLASRIIFFKNWTYRLELPLSSISEISYKQRFGVKTLMVKKGKKIIPVCATGITRSQVLYLQGLMNTLRSRRNQK